MSRTAAHRPAPTPSIANRAAATACASSGARSDSRRCSSTSGWRRTMPVAEHGASSSTASKGAPSHQLSSAAHRRQPGAALAPARGARRSCGRAAGAPRRLHRDQAQSRVAFEQVRGLAAGRGAGVEHACPGRQRQGIGHAVAPRGPAPTPRLRETRQLGDRQARVEPQCLGAAGVVGVPLRCRLPAVAADRRRAIAAARFTRSHNGGACVLAAKIASASSRQSAAGARSHCGQCAAGSPAAGPRVARDAAAR